MNICKLISFQICYNLSLLRKSNTESERVKTQWSNDRRTIFVLQSYEDRTVCSDDIRSPNTGSTTVLCRYNTFNYLLIPYKRHVRGMERVFLVQTLVIFFLLLSEKRNLWYHDILERVITTLDFTLKLLESRIAVQYITHPLFPPPKLRYRMPSDAYPIIVWSPHSM